ncbi:MAG: hypothetical protein H3C41_01205 [Bacteroidales bacterium]|nr:hypothetical protein [Bacteroidales bacterium]
MKKTDFTIIACIVLIGAVFVFMPQVLQAYNTANSEHGMWMSFVKFAVLATFGEALALRIRTGHYYHPGFGLLPRALVWGFLGLTIKMAFTVFASGVPVFVQYLGYEQATTVLKTGPVLGKIGVAFCISTLLNVVYAPVMMTFHKITDTHIVQNGGTLTGLFKPIHFAQILKEIDWDRMWNFVFKKTIPFFWIPAHTITFLLPETLQVLFAALLSVALGVLLSLKKT